jgi:hypothetical protein
MDNQEEFPIWVNLQANYQPSVFDLSGNVPFELYLETRRSAVHDTDPRDLVIVKTGSVFDLPAALDKGLVELIDEASMELVPYHGNVDQAQAQLEGPTAITSESFITLPTDVPGKERAMQTVPLHAALCLRPLVRPGHKYRLRLRGNDIGVQWWAWGNPPDSHGNGTELSSTESMRLISSRQSCAKKFAVVSGMAIPPKLSICLSLAESAHVGKEGRGADAEAPSPAIQITITNTNGRPITIKSSGDQPHLWSPGEVPNPRSRITAERPDVQNFSVVDHETQEELISDAPTFVSPIAGGRGWPRRQFLTLEPHQRVTRTVTLPGQRLTAGREYHVSLRRTGCWWADGTLDDLFGHDNAVLKKWPAGPMAPILLASEDVVVLHC